MFQDGPDNRICSGSFRRSVAQRNVSEPTKTLFCPDHPNNPESPRSVVHPPHHRTERPRLTLTDARSQVVQTETRLVRVTSAIGFPFNGFTYCLTLFSKFFSSFPHGTCSLSVSYQYLALDEVYHPLNAALSSSATQRKRIIKAVSATMDGALTLRGSVFQHI